MDIRKNKPIRNILLGMVVFGLIGCNPRPVETNNLPIDTRNLTPAEFAQYNLVGEDMFGRKIERINGLKEGQHWVGLFYSVWLGGHPHQQTGIYNITQMLETEEGTANLYSLEDNEQSKINEFHFWGEPLYGYYDMSDPWVVRRHIELFVHAGIDYLCLDNTNDVVYYSATENLMDALLEYQAQGYTIPKIVFYTNSNSGDTVNKIYNRWYRTEKYQDLWFTPNGKPMIIGITENNNKASDQTKYYPGFDKYISEEMINFFDVKESEWPNGDFNDNSIPWMSWEYPQYIHDGSVAVPVAQHSHSAISASWMHDESSRGYDNETGGKANEDFRLGRSFEQMWKLPLSDESVNNVLVCSYNEWMAIKQIDGNNRPFWVDVFNEEYSRDIELMRGGYEDSFLLQLIRNIRKYKYKPFIKYKKPKLNITLNENASPLWNSAAAVYQDFAGDAIARNFRNASHTAMYTDNSNRNDITTIKVAHNDNNVFFYIETLNPITPYNGSDLNYMNIFLKTTETDKNFFGYNYVINRNIANGKGSVEKSIGGYNFEQVGEAEVVIKDNVMQVRIPQNILIMNKDVDFEFKVSDNVTNYMDIMDYYVTGDSAPVGRLSYAY